MNNISFDISTAFLAKNCGKAVRPDKTGTYKNLPMLVLGIPSRNGKVYETESMVESLTGANSMFYRQLISTGVEGEWGHPMIPQGSEDINRIMTVDRSRVSHKIVGIRTGEKTEKGHVVVYGDIQLAGPYGQYLKEDLESPYRNASFSLRSLVSKTGEDGNLIYQKVNLLVTIDAVSTPGFWECSKVTVPGTEGLEARLSGDPQFDGYSFKISNPARALQSYVVAHGEESIQDQQLLDILETDEVRIGTTIRGVIDPSNGTYTKHDGSVHNLFHNILKQ
jgi:hypothetical protein